MKNCLFLNTCFKAAQIGLVGEHNEFCEVGSECKHSEHVLPQVDQLLNSTKLSTNDIDCYAVDVGPGSFTGIRIGVALIKGLAFGKNVPVVAFNSFEIIAKQYFLENEDKQEVVVLLDGLKGFVFLAKLNREGEFLVEPSVFDQKQMAEFIAGNACEYICHKEEGGKFSLRAVEPKFEAYKALLEQKLKRKQLISSKDIAPLYLRKSQAEDELEKKQNENH